jgi:hypothetical protein
MTRISLAAVTLLAFVTMGLADPASRPVLAYAGPPLLFKAKPPSTNAKPVPASASRNDVLYRQYLDWRKKHP